MAINEEFEDEQDVQDIIDKVLSLKIFKRGDAMKFLYKEIKECDKAKFSDNQ